MDSQIVKTLRIRPFLFLWLAELTSQIAMNMMNFILVILVYALTNSNTAVSGVVLAFTIPAILFGVIAGVYVDRWDKKIVLFSTNIIRAMLLLVLALSHTNIVAIYFLSFAVTFVTQFFIPAETPMIPLLVPKELLLSANALFGIALYGSILIAYALSGPSLMLLGSTNIFLLLTGVYVLATVFVVCIRSKAIHTKAKEVVGKKVSLFPDIKHAFQTVAPIPGVSRSFLFLTLSQTITLVIAVLGPGFAKHVLHISIDAFPLLFVTPAAVGMVFGAVLLTNYFHSYSKRNLTTIGIFLSAFSIVLLAYGSYPFMQQIRESVNMVLSVHITMLHMMGFIAFIMGFANALVFVPSNTLLQEKTTEELRGRIYGALNTAASLLSLLPIMVIGPLADFFGVVSVLMGVGIVVGIIGIIDVIVDRGYLW